MVGDKPREHQAEGDHDCAEGGMAEEHPSTEAGLTAAVEIVAGEDRDGRNGGRM